MSDASTLRVLRIIEGTSVDGPGLRTSIYLAGCDHHCPGCHNPQSWDAAGGTPMSVDDLVATIARAEMPLTLSGGDPLRQAAAVAHLTARVKAALGIDIWLYTGYTWEQIAARDDLLAVMRHIDTVVDGPFILAERDTTLHFRGSHNQRIINIPATLTTGQVTPRDFPYSP